MTNNLNPSDITDKPVIKSKISLTKFKFVGDYLLQLFTVDNRYNFYPPSIIAFTVTSLCYRLKHGKSLVPEGFSKNCSHNINHKIFNPVYLPKELISLCSEEEKELISKCYIDILFNLFYSGKIQYLKTAYIKFSKNRFKKVALLDELQIEI